MLKLQRLHISYVNRTPIRCGFCVAAKGYSLFYCLLVLFGSILKYSLYLLIITTTHTTYILRVLQVNVIIEIDRKSFKIPQNKFQLLQQVLFAERKQKRSQNGVINELCDHILIFITPGTVSTGVLKCQIFFLERRKCVIPQVARSERTTTMTNISK